MNLQLYNVAPNLPAELKFLETLADNVWWCWHPDAIDLFTRINVGLWRELGGNPKRFLRHVSQERLEELARDRNYVKVLNNLKAAFEREVTPASRDFSKRAVAYFSLEFGIHESIPIFSGGLGVLAGDHLKAASDLSLPLVAVGLLYRQGYFRQVLDRTGLQTEHYPVAEIHDLPVRRGCDADGEPVTISMRLGDRELFAAVWELRVGNVPLLLLAWRTMGKTFVFKLILCTVTQSVLMTVIPVPAQPIIEDMLTTCLIGGLLNGMALGLIPCLLCGWIVAMIA